jgi:hypothetical protein
LVLDFFITKINCVFCLRIKTEHPCLHSYLRQLLRKIALVAILCLSLKNTAQVLYSTNVNYLKTKPEGNNLISNYKASYPDTNINSLNNFLPRNFMGNIGLPSPNYLLNYGTDAIGFRFFDTPTQHDRFKESDVDYFRTKGPYASLTGIAGSKQLQLFKLLFTHTYKDKMNIALKFNRYSSLGFYRRQQSYTNNFSLSSNYSSTNKRFGYYLYMINNGNRNLENGGIENAVLTPTTVNQGKDLLSVNLTTANRDNRETKTELNPWFRLNKKNDSLTRINHYLQLKLRGAINTYKYKDANIQKDDFYDLFYLDTSQTRDSSNIKQLSNEINYTALSANNNFGFSFGYKNELNKVWQKRDSVFFNHVLTTNLVFRKSINSRDTSVKKQQSLESVFSGQYIFSGANSGNFKLENIATYQFNAIKESAVFLNLLYEKRSADYIYNHWISNHFYWYNNGYRSQEQAQLKLGVNLSKEFTASVFYQNLYNYLYFDDLALPRQYNKTLSNIGLSASYTHVFFKHVGLSLNHIYQSTSNTSYIRLPQNISTAALFYHGNLFKNNLQLQLGSQIQVYQSFYAYGYMPATQAFYLQEPFQTESYPFVDVYLNARIRPVSFFLKVENILSSGRSGLNYAFVPGYYQNDLAFRFGLTWLFFD